MQTVLREQSSRKTVYIKEQITSKDKCTSIWLLCLLPFKCLLTAYYSTFSFHFYISQINFRLIFYIFISFAS